MALYIYYPCEGSSGTTFTSNVNPSTSLVGANISFPNLRPNECYHIALFNQIPQPAPDEVIDWSTEVYALYPTCQDCINALNVPQECLCSTVQNTGVSIGSYRYIDCEGFSQEINLDSGETSEKLCVREWLQNANAYYEFYGDCVNGKCPVSYLLRDCTNPDNTFCTNSDLNAFADNDISVVLNGEQYAGKCWTVETATECINPVVVTVQFHYVNCPTCLNQFATNYELVNCTDESEVIYTSTDLSEYAGQVLKLEDYDNDCWFVRVINSQIPSDTPIVITGSFATCQECTSNYYLLEDCNTLSATEPIVTITDLSQYVGQVITLTTCPEICWTVSETEYSPEYQSVLIDDNTYTECAECLSTLPSKCVSITNTSTETISYSYVDQYGSQKINVGAGETIPKLCAITWETPEFIVITVSGDCINNECPSEPTRLPRKVTPGYNTPACSTDYYEKVVCNFSEWMYKDVLNKRYGISNCCPEDLLKWQIKYEKLMLDVLINPDYTCTSTTDCCGPNITLNYSRDCNS